jgi:hypothetical protein
MTRPRSLLLASAVLGVAVFAASAFGQTRAHRTLVGVVGPHDAYRITLTTNGKLVKTLRAGTYTLSVHDDSSIHNYELDGPQGKSWAFTSVPFKGVKTVTLKLVAGKYKAYCAPHESVMFQHFTVTR